MTLFPKVPESPFFLILVNSFLVILVNSFILCFYWSVLQIIQAKSFIMVRYNLYLIYWACKEVLSCFMALILPKKAERLCERDLQCGGFTFKGVRNVTGFVPEIYFFHFVNESAKYLTTEIKYPHWTTYVVGSRRYVAIRATYNIEGTSQRETIYEE